MSGKNDKDAVEPGSPPTDSSRREGRGSVLRPATYNARRSSVLSCHACVATSQNLATQIGVRVLQELKGNAADAAVAVSAALAVLEPCSTGLGGDMFALYYHAASKTVHAVNGSGRSPRKLTRERVQQDLGGSLDRSQFQFSPHAVTVPGAVMGWADLLQRHGSGTLTLAQLLEPAAQLAQDGFPVGPITAQQWQHEFHQVQRWFTDKHQIPFTVDGRHPPRAGQVVKNLPLARILRQIGKDGALAGFYTGPVAEAIVSALQSQGGVMELEDLATHTSTFPDPISVTYRNQVRLWQVPPNGQGIAGLIALKAVETLEQQGLLGGRPLGPQSLPSNSSAALHGHIEAMRMAFGEARRFVCDPDAPASGSVPTLERWLDEKRIAQRITSLFDPDKAIVQDEPPPLSCTVSFQVVDDQGNAISFVNSNYMGFGTGLVPDQCGFTLQNRGMGFELEDTTHPNVLAGHKRPYHTILPAMLTHADDNELYATLSNMGGFMQPQGHLQLTINVIAGGLDPQSAIDTPRFCIFNGQQGGGEVYLEEGIDEEIVAELENMGHCLRPNVSGYDRIAFGRAQIILRDRETHVLWAGSDTRADGCAMGY